MTEIHLPSYGVMCVETKMWPTERLANKARKHRYHDKTLKVIPLNGKFIVGY